jgi:phage terminase large subunit-like protein
VSELTLLLAERERRRRQEVALDAPRWDWYGPDCGCPPEVRRPGGSCPEHKRARPNQRPPEGPWSIWYFEAGRGSGKTEAGAQWIRWKAEQKGKNGRFALVAPTAADARDVMVEGPSGIIAVSPPWFLPEYSPSKRRLVWPNGAIAITYSADEPERLRGPQHTDAWCDELCSWRDPAAWDMLMMGLRLRKGGHEPQAFISTTPKPLPWTRRIKRMIGAILTKGSTYDNRDNLADSYFHTIITKYEGTRLGRQELEAEDLEDTPGALWTTRLLDDLRIARQDLPELVRVVVAVDPSVADPKADPDTDISECGITVGGMAYLQHPTLGHLPHGYLLADRSVKGHPIEWGHAVVNAAKEFGADLVVAEVNNGGALVATNLQSIQAGLPVKLLHASRGKQTRAEPVATMYEQRRVFHLAGEDFSLLEGQMCTWVQGLKSPDRMDALVWLFTELLLEGTPITFGPHPFEDWR